MAPDTLILPDRRLAYQRQPAATRESPSGAGIIFLSGYASDMMGAKAGYLAERCAEAGVPYLRFDYRGHGQSGGRLTDFTLGDWFDDAREVFDRLTQGPQILVGSSMGGWLALLLARRNPRARAVVGVAAAPDFTEDLIWARLSDEQRIRLQRDGVMEDETEPPESRLPITMRLIEEARSHLLLREPMPIACPLRLVQGMKDPTVPWEHALRILEKAETSDARVTLIKDGDHRLSKPHELEALWRAVREFV